LQETYLGKVKMIYIDPPYNTGMILSTKMTSLTADEYLKRSNQKDESGNRLVANTESNGRFHSDWLMMYPRLKFAPRLMLGTIPTSLRVVAGRHKTLEHGRRLLRARCAGGQSARFDLFVDNIKPDRTPEDLLFQVMLDWGVDLALPIAKQPSKARTCSSWTATHWPPASTRTAASMKPS
jgi:hypothetical protein